MEKINNNHGFTLIELSIVIVVIGLIVAAISAGSSLVRQAKLQSIASESSYFKTAFYNFRSEYRALPGDFNKASSFWSGETNGDGDNKIETGSNLVAPIEDILFWKHLSLAGLIRGGYTGSIAGTERFEIGTNCPASKLSGGSYQPFYASSAHYGKTGNNISFASLTGNTSKNLNGQIVSAREARSIDIKIDDGEADKGNVYTLSSAQYDATNSVCTDAEWTSASGSYVLTDDTIGCRMIFWLD